MNIALINKETNICENIAVFENMKATSEMFGETFIVVETQECYGIGDTYKDSIWSKATQLTLTNAELREQAYETMLYKDDGMTLLEWEGIAITVDQANKKWLDYSAEGSTVANELSALIVSAKAYIRELYPDDKLA